jgi:hypothetical protein
MFDLLRGDKKVGEGVVFSNSKTSVHWLKDGDHLETYEYYDSAEAMLVLCAGSVSSIQFQS